MCKNRRLPAHVRKLNICTAGKEVFLIKSFPKTTMEDVARKAKISKGCLYSYYKNTYEILYDLVAYYKYNIIENISSIVNEYGKFNSFSVLTSNIIDMIFKEKEIRAVYVIFLIEIQNDKKLKMLYKEIANNSLIDNEFTQLIESIALSIEILDIKRNSIVFKALYKKLQEFQIHYS